MSRIEADAYAVLQRLGASPVTQVLTAGGGAGNPVWTAMRQTALGVPVSPAKNGEGGGVPVHVPCQAAHWYLSGCMFSCLAVCSTLGCMFNCRLCAQLLAAFEIVGCMFDSLAVCVSCKLHVCLERKLDNKGMHINKRLV